MRDRDVLGVDDELGPEPAAEIGGADDDPVLVEPERRDQGAERAMRRLARQPERQAVVERVGDGDGAAAFDGEPEPLVLSQRDPHKMRGGGERRLDVAIADVVFGEQIVVEMAMRDRRARRDRIAAVGNRGERAVVDFDQLRRVLGGVAALGDHHGDRLPDMANLVLRQDLPIQDMAVRGARQRGDQPPGGEMRRDLGMAQHRFHPRHRRRRRHVDACDFGMGEGAADEARVQHPRQIDIVHEPPGAAQQRRILKPLDRLADQGAAQLCRPRSVTTRSNAARVSSLTWCSMPSASARATSSLTPIAWRKATTIWCRRREASAMRRPSWVRKIAR